MNTGFAIAASLALLTWGIHTFVGTPQIARPLLDSDMEPVPKYTNFYGWHLVTIVLFAMAGGFGYAATTPQGGDVGVLMTLLSGAFGLWSILLIAWKHRHPMQLPQWTLFVAVTAAGLVGVLT
jgi:hypothetical protein